MPGISHQQAEALRVMEWLLSDDIEDRRSGRSFVLALALVRFAMERREQNFGTAWVRLLDHTLPTGVTSEGSGCSLVLGYIRQIAEAVGATIELNDGSRRFRIHSGDPNLVVVRQRLYSEFPETDVHVGLSPEELARHREMHVPVPQLASPTSRRSRTGEPSLRDRVIQYVERNPGRTATQIARALQHHNDAVASTLYKEARVGNLDRTPGDGPRGGFTYSVPQQVVGPSVWEIIRERAKGEV